MLSASALICSRVPTATTLPPSATQLILLIYEVVTQIIKTDPAYCPDRFLLWPAAGTPVSSYNTVKIPEPVHCPVLGPRSYNWKIPDLSVWEIFRRSICLWDFLILKLKGEGWEALWSWNFCSITWQSRSISCMCGKAFIWIICWICFKWGAEGDRKR